MDLFLIDIWEWKSDPRVSKHAENEEQVVKWASERQVQVIREKKNWRMCLPAVILGYGMPLLLSH